MKVANLIAHLSKLPQDLEVLVGDDDDGYAYAIFAPACAGVDDDSHYDYNAKDGLQCVVMCLVK
jgi:hypothetical protein